MLRFLWPLLLMFGPQLAPRVIKFVRAVWRLHKDHRVNILLKLLVPLSLVYAVWPWDFVKDRIPFGLGRYDDIIIFRAGPLHILEAVPAGGGARAHGRSATASTRGPGSRQRGGRRGPPHGR